MRRVENAPLAAMQLLAKILIHVGLMLDPLSHEQARPQLWISYARRERCCRRCGLHLALSCCRASQGAIDSRERKVDLPAIVAQPQLLSQYARRFKMCDGSDRIAGCS